jgi:hypothetical protein
VKYKICFWPISSRDLNYHVMARMEVKAKKGFVPVNSSNFGCAAKSKYGRANLGPMA